MNTTCANVITLIIFSTVLPCFASTTRLHSSSPTWLRSTSLVETRNNCPVAPVLYRGITGDFFPIEKALKNMLGDVLAELPSWRLSVIYKSLPSNESSDEEKWEYAKQIAKKELELLKQKNTGPTCSLANIFADMTMQGHDLNSRSKSLGIAFTPKKSYAAGYINAKIYEKAAPALGSSTQSGIMIGIREHIPRAGFASEYGRNEFAEFYVPIFVPHEDIFAAWTNSFHIEKKSDSSGQIRVEIYRVKNAVEALKLSKNLDEVIVAEIVPCSHADTCEELPTAGQLDLEVFNKALLELKIRGIRYKLVTY